MRSKMLLRALAGLIALPAAVQAQTMTMKINEAPLADVEAFIEQLSDVRLEIAGVDPATLVSFEVQGAGVEQTIERLCDAIGGVDAPTWQRRADGVLEIAPREILNKRQHIVVYDVRDLLHVVPTFDQTPELDLQAALSNRSGGGSIFRADNAPTRFHELDETAPIKEIADLVRAFVEPDQWTWVGGEGATMIIHQQSLIVRAPTYVHRQIGR